MASRTRSDTRITTDICVIGAGSAGLSVAAGAAQMGARVVLIERHVRGGVMGGDCLHTGCVPSKAMLAAGKLAKSMREAQGFGIAATEPQVDFAAVNDHVKSVIAAIAPVDSVERFEKLGVTVLQASARFIDEKTLEADGIEVRAKFFVVATGSKAGLPPIPGLETVDVLTNETIFDNRTRPEHLVIVGAGPIGMELAQAHRRLGSQVTVLERFKALPRDDAEATAIVKGRLRKEGVTIEEDAEIDGVEETPGGGVRVSFRNNGQSREVTGSHILVAAGRQPVVDGLNLDAAGVKHSPRGIEVSDRLKTSNSRIFAIGDVVAGGQQFTHVAGYHAGIVIRNALFRVPAKADLSHNPRVTYTDPELASVGLSEAEARERHGDKVTVTKWEYAENDRAQAERETEGFIKVVTLKNGRILGVTIVGAQAGEVLQPWLLALSKKMKMSDMTGFIAPYPTLGELNKRVAGQFFTPTLFGPRVRGLVKTLLKLP